jgi:hypothetical protein
MGGQLPTVYRWDRTGFETRRGTRLKSGTTEGETLSWLRRGPNTPERESRSEDAHLTDLWLTTHENAAAENEASLSTWAAVSHLFAAAMVGLLEV